MAPGDPTVTRREPAAGEPARGEPARGEPAAGEPARGEPVAGEPVAGGPVRRKPTLAQLRVDPADLDWRRSGTGAGSLEVAFIRAGGDAVGAHIDDEGARADWVLLRVAGDPDGRVLVYNRTEWMCFLDGVERGEFG